MDPNQPALSLPEGTPAAVLPAAPEADSHWRRDAGLLALLAAGILLYEILLTRLFAITLFANYAFLAIGMALLGIGAGGFWASRDLSRGRSALDRRVWWGVVLFAAGAWAVFHFGARIELIPTEGEAINGDTLGRMSFTSRRNRFVEGGIPVRWGAFFGLMAAVFLPFLAAGYSQAVLLAGRARKAGYLYAADIAGAVAGSLGSLLALRWLGGLNSIGLVALLSAAAALGLERSTGRRPWAMAIGLGLGALGVGTLGLQPIRIHHAAGFNEDRIVDWLWSSFCRVSVYEHDPDEHMILVDNASRSYVGYPREVGKYRSDVYSIPFEMRPADPALIIGAGGGEEILAAHATASPGLRRTIDAVEVAPGFPEMLRAWGGSPNVLDTPGLNYVIGDGRSFVQMSRTKYGVIEMREVNFHSLAGEISLAWSPTLLFTVEAYEQYLNHLTPDGLLAVTKGVRGNPDGLDFVQMLASIHAAFDRMGWDRFGDHVAMVVFGRPRDYKWVMILVSPSPFSEADKEALRQRVSDRRLPTRVLYLPGRPSEYDRINAAIGENYLDFIADHYRRNRVNLYPIRDDRPFVRNQIRELGLLKEAARLLEGKATDLETGGRIQVLNTLLMLGTVGGFFLLAMGANALFLLGAPRGRRGGYALDLLLFSMLGLGFMIYEMVLIESSSLLLGHPTRALATVLTALLVALALGSYGSQRWSPERRPCRRRAIALAAPLSILLGEAGLKLLEPALRQIASGTARMTVVLLFLTLLSVPLGFLLPTAMRVRLASHPNRAAAAWAMNGLWSVLATGLAFFTVRAYGFNATFLIALAIYLAAGALWNQRVRLPAES